MIFPRTRQIGPDIEHRLRSARRRAKPGNHLVEDQHDAMPQASFTQPAQKAMRRRNDADVSRDRFDDDRRDGVRVGVDQRVDRRHAVVAREQRLLGHWRRDTGAGRDTQRHRAGPGFHQERIGVPVIAALELDDQLAPRERPRDADGAHRRFSAGADETHTLQRWHQRADAFAELVLER
jgi:hypothetical protein